MDDAVLHGEIAAILNRMIADPSLVQPGSIPAADPPLEIRRLTNEVDRELDSFEFDKEKTKKAIFALAAEKYRNIDSKQHKAYIVRAEFEKSNLLSSFLSELFKRTVLKVQLGDGIVRLIFKNHQIIGKENDHAENNNTISDANNPA